MSAPPKSKRKPDVAPTPDRPADSPAAAPQPAAQVVEEAAQKSQEMTPDEIAAWLADPFPASVVGWKPQTAKENRALAVAYIDARDVMDRLDAVMGIDGWQDQYDEQADGTVRCILSLRLAGEWISKQDVGGESEQKDPGDKHKAAYSDALKRAAVKWGIGRYLYSLPATWADYDPQRRDFVRPPSLPAWALPGGSGRPGVQSPTQPAPRPAARPAAKASPDSSDFHRQLQEYDGKLAAGGLCDEGDLVKSVAAAGKRNGYPADMTTWSEAQIGQAREVTKDFVARHNLVAEVNVLLDRKGQKLHAIYAKLRIKEGPLRDLSAEQLARAKAALLEMDDAPQAKAG